MAYSEHRKRTLELLEQEIVTLHEELEKKKKLRDSLNQELLSLSDKREKTKDMVSLIRDSESLQKRIGESLIDIQHIDTKIWRLKHRAERLRHILF